MKIWTGHTGEAHITAELFRTLLIGIFGMGSYIFQVWEKFEHTLESNNSMLIKRGMMIHHGNGGSGAPGKQIKTWGTNLTLSKTIPTRSGYKFLGWGTSSADTTPDYQPGGTYSINAGITLYAIWKRKGQLHIVQDGRIKKGRAYLKKDNVWKTGIPWINVKGTWKRGGV